MASESIVEDNGECSSSTDSAAPTGMQGFSSIISSFIFILHRSVYLK